jgi:hypothetical protein
MLHRLSAAALAALLLPACLTDSPDSDNQFAADGDGADEGFAPPLSTYDEIFPEGRVVVAPDPITKAPLPPQFDLVELQSPVKNQASRGVCSIFASAALMEHLYIKAGIPDLDVSEQYLQWATKFQSREFTNTDGSNNSVNLDTIATYGIPTEEAWRYETSPWAAPEHPECTGTSRPMLCYTNGEPPASARAASTYKIKLPPPRTVGTDAASIKQHMATKQTAVAIGVEFFYQAWNHRNSRLTISNDRLLQGIVLNPNRDDETDSSGDRRAGHAVLLVGWDDTLEIQRVDRDGNPLRNDRGELQIDKGFFIFKNSWGTSRFGVENPHGPGYGFISYEYVRRFANALRVEVPTVQAERCNLATGDEDLDGLANCEDSDCATAPVCATEPEEPGVLTFSATPNASIPDDNTTGASSTITISDAATIGSLSVSLDIAHSWIGDLNVTLSNGSTTITLHNNTGRDADNIVKTVTVADFNGQSLAGTWTLKAVDSASSDVGTIRSWSLAATPR